MSLTLQEDAPRAVHAVWSSSDGDARWCQGAVAYQAVLEGLGALAVANGYLPALDEDADELREDRVVDAGRHVWELDVHAVHRLAWELQRDCRGGAQSALCP